MALVKSHSNYVLKRLHQTSNSGNIFERDITTIGGVNHFSPGQVPIYKSSNFIITVNNENPVSKNYGASAWVPNGVSGDTWTLDSMEGLILPTNDSDMEIVLKQDFYDLRDFSYYGSCTELIRASITDIMNRFPGELYVCDANTKRYYESIETGTGAKATTLEYGQHLKKNNKGDVLYQGQWIPKGGSPGATVAYSNKTNQELLGDDIEVYGKSAMKVSDGERVIIDNPFNINVYSSRLPRDISLEDKIRWFAGEGYKNYQVIKKDGTVSNIKNFSGFNIDDKCYNVGDLITVDGGNKFIEIQGIKIYLYYGENGGIVYMTDKANTGIHIRPKAELLETFKKSLDQFQRILLNPNTTPAYTATFQIIRENDFGYYNTIEKFTFPKAYGGYNISANSDDYNSYVGKLTNIASFYDERFCDNLYRSMTPESLKNFDFTRSFDEETQEEYQESGDRIKKTIRIWGREYDEIKSYIDAIGLINNVTYNERGNVPNYLLTDLLEADGWDIKLVHPFELDRYRGNSKDNTDSAFTETIGKNNVQSGYYNKFSRNTSGTCQPYLVDIENTQQGHYNNTVSIEPCGLDVFITPYSSNKEYSYSNIGNEFLRRLKANSKAILRSKGTIHGVEMLLSLFGLKSSRFCEDSSGAVPDYSIEEYSVVTSGITDCWDESHQMNLHDWYNSKKLINYEYDSSVLGASNDSAYVNYQGLPVISYTYGDFYTSNDPTKKTQVLFPNFEKNEPIDGNPYFQMNGGWRSKFLQTTNNDLSFMFTKDGDVITSNPSEELFYHETLRNVKNVQSVAELFVQPYNSLIEGAVYRVNNITSKDYAFINGSPFELHTNEDGKRYVIFTVKNGYVSIPGKYGTTFSEKITVLGRDDKNYDISLNGLPNGYEIEAYYNPDATTEQDKFVLRGANDYNSILYFDVFINGKSSGDNNKKYTQYFQLVNLCEGADAMFAKYDNNGNVLYGGWKQLEETDKLYLKLSSIIDYYNGNNPHNGNFVYDNGYAYLKYYTQLFNYSFDNDLFDDRCFNDITKAYDDIENFGFKDVINTSGLGNYIVDRKVNAYTHIYSVNGNQNEVFLYDYPKTYNEVKGKDYIQNKYSSQTLQRSNIEMYKTKGLVEQSNYEFGNGYTCNGQTLEVDKNTTNRFMNTKRIDVTFYLKSDKWYSRDGLCELKYLDSVVIPYMEQMVPSNAILSVHFEKHE